MNYYDDVGFAYQRPPGLISAPIRRDTRKKQLKEEQDRRDYQGLLERDLIGIQQFSPFFGLNSRDPDSVPVAPMDVLPAGAGAKALGLLSSAIPVGMIGQLAYHGGRKWAPEAGARLGRPRLENVGEGSGGSAYGHGLNVSDSPRVAQSYRDAIPGREGYSYKMDVPDADVAKMLDYEASFNDQAPAVQKIIRQIYKEMGFPRTRGWLSTPGQGGLLYSRLERALSKRGLTDDYVLPDKEAASKYLASKGIPGLKHADAVGDPPIRNMVIWDEDLLKRIKVLGRQ